MILGLYLTSLRDVKAAIGQVLSTPLATCH